MLIVKGMNASRGEASSRGRLQILSVLLLFD